jgi:hypothetical protein
MIWAEGRVQCVVSVPARMLTSLDTAKALIVEEEFRHDGEMDSCRLVVPSDRWTT